MTPTRHKLPVIDDEPDLLRGLRDALEFEGYAVISAATAAEGVEAAKREAPDAVILDLMLPDGNGYQVCEAIRKEPGGQLTPIIMLSARSQESDKIRGLEVGADDYVTKPFSIGELCARVKAIFRRQGRVPREAEVIAIGDGEVHLRKHVLKKGRKETQLTFYEVELLKLLAERADEPVSRDEILDKIWGIQNYPTNRTVDNFIVKLRRKLEVDHKNPRHIVTVYGYGYKLVP